MLNPVKWVQRTANKPQKVEDHEDGTRHYLCQIEEHDNRWRRVIVNIEVTPERAVTTFFDRRLRRTTCELGSIEKRMLCIFD